MAKHSLKDSLLPIANNAIRALTPKNEPTTHESSYILSSGLARLSSFVAPNSKLLPYTMLAKHLFQPRKS